MTDPASFPVSDLSTPHSRRKETPGGDELLALANRVRRLSPSHRDPEAFHVEKDAIAHSLRRLATGGRHGQS